MTHIDAFALLISLGIAPVSLLLDRSKDLEASEISTKAKMSLV
jgi:hypothetical protein